MLGLGRLFGSRLRGGSPRCVLVRVRPLWEVCRLMLGEVCLLVVGEGCRCRRCRRLCGTAWKFRGSVRVTLVFLSPSTCSFSSRFYSILVLFYFLPWRIKI